ncbi:DUF2970 domain-containing protein [Verticiella sediminum]|uniref:DUF2970 domain-containing protein n=1 Tax=Verticiella sediminum TaxID=1247510 RepID=A0A556AKG0_9BURK|nr:DUF2970 domain-containing protein [Verticiella sediminum]TSH93335.1 DUF2970 domain-containing protein [Verticiella sediminum]
MQENREAPPPKAGFWRTMRAVLWSFLGVRRNRGYEDDARQLNPVYVILAGLLAAAAFVAALIVIVRMVVAHA